MYSIQYTIWYNLYIYTSIVAMDLEVKSHHDEGSCSNTCQKPCLKFVMTADRRVSCWSFAGNWFGMKPRLHGLARLYYREKVQHVDTYSCKNLYLDPPRVLNFSPTRSVVGVFFWRTNFTPDWRIWAYKHLSWSSWLASLVGPRCTVFFVIYERLLRILVEADQILSFLSVICLTYIHPLHIPIVSMGHHGYMFTIPPGSVAFFWDPGIETWDPFSTLQALQAFA